MIRISTGIVLAANTYVTAATIFIHPESPLNPYIWVCVALSSLIQLGVSVYKASEEPLYDSWWHRLINGRAGKYPAPRDHWLDRL